MSASVSPQGDGAAWDDAVKQYQNGAQSCHPHEPIASPPPQKARPHFHPALLSFVSAGSFVTAVLSNNMHEIHGAAV